MPSPASRTARVPAIKFQNGKGSPENQRNPPLDRQPMQVTLVSEVPRHSDRVTDIIPAKQAQTCQKLMTQDEYQSYMEGKLKWQSSRQTKVFKYSSRSNMAEGSSCGFKNNHGVGKSPKDQTMPNMPPDLKVSSRSRKSTRGFADVAENTQLTQQTV